MADTVAVRRAFLQARKNAGKRVTIGFAGIADFRSFIGQEYIAGITKAAADYDINLINMADATKYSLFDDIAVMSRYKMYFRFMKAPLVDGLVTWASSLGGYLAEKEIIALFSALRPLPLVDIGYLDIPGVPSLRIDNDASIALLFEHLVGVHHYRHFAFIGTTISEPHRSRLQAYHRELQKYALPCLADSVYMAASLEDADIEAQVALLCQRYFSARAADSALPKLDVIITSSDIIASAVIDALEKRGIIVPHDVAVTGFNNQYAGLLARAPVTTTNLEYFKRGYAAVELLLDSIAAPAMVSAHTRLFPTSLVVRQSCGCSGQGLQEQEFTSRTLRWFQNFMQQQDKEFNTMSRIAVSFAQATSGTQIQDMLRHHLGELGIPGLVLALSDHMTQEVSAASVQMLLPPPPADIQQKLPYKIHDPAAIPKLFFPQGRRYSLKLELLYHADKYFGWAFFEVGTQNIALCDAVRMLLSNALHTVYLKEGRSKTHPVLLQGEQLMSILHVPEPPQDEQKGALTARHITDYLIAHLDTMTNLDTIASDLSVSKSHLVRRAKELTGYSIQTLHEKLKIEQAKIFLHVADIKLAEIAARLGFQNQNYFSTVFKKNTGLSPKEWARRNVSR